MSLIAIEIFPGNGEEGTTTALIRPEAVTSVVTSYGNTYIDVGRGTYRTPLSVDEVANLLGVAR